MKLHTRFLLLCCLFMTQSIFAEEVEGLYTVDVSAHSQSREDRNTALSEAMQLVLSRFFSTQEFARNPKLKPALENAAAYVDQYRYIQNLDDAAKKSAVMMQVSFNKDSLNTLMRSSGLAMWGAQRDKTLLWMVIQQGAKRTFLELGQDSGIAAAVQAAARSTGIPLLLPLMDLEEKQALSVKDILATKPDKILAASERYGIATILSGKLVKRRSCWRSEWALHFNKRDERWTTPCGELKTNLTHAMQMVYEHLSVFYAQKP